MATAIIFVFLLGYMAIVFEHVLRLDKTVSALIMAAAAWALLALGFQQGWLNVIDAHDTVFSLVGSTGEEAQHHPANEGFHNTLLHHLGKTAEILIFLIGAMTIVEIVDLHRGFDVLKDYIKTRNKRKLLWMVGVLAFLLSAIIDNLTATIVLVTLLRKIVPDRQERLWFVSLIIIAANAGGAWSPIGDVTTTMLWIGNKVSAAGLVEYLILPSIACFVVPFFVAAYFLPHFKGDIAVPVAGQEPAVRLLSSRTMLFVGLGAIVFVPLFKTVTHLPPYVGMMLSLGLVWLVAEYIRPEPKLTREQREKYSPHKALARIEMSSILFFLGILMAVSALESLVFATILHEGEYVQVGTLRYMAEALDKFVPNQDAVVLLLGMASAIIDNVPLVAASMGMYDMPTDAKLWNFIAYSAGTGGSMLIIGSAAGVAAMGMERIDFLWYLRKVAWLAFLGFISGAAVFLLTVI